MLIKFFERGIGDGAAPVNYCCDVIVPTVITITDEKGRNKSAILRDENGKPVLKTRDPPPRILRGDKELTKNLINSLDFKWKYSAGVIAFGPDEPEAKKIDEIMDDFETAAFAGLDRDRFNSLWIEHLHEGVIELHFLIPRVDLATGKSYNPAPPGHKKIYDPLRDYWNYSQGFARPDDLNRARLYQPGNVAKQQAANLRANLPAAPDPKKLITDFLTERIGAGMIENRADILSVFKELGFEITRNGKDYISVKPEPGAKAIRLKGVIYGESFERSEFIRQVENQSGDGSTTDRTVDLVRAEAARRQFEESVRRRTEYNINRYNIGNQKPDNTISSVISGDPDRGGVVEQNATESMVKTDVNDADDLNRFLFSKLGPDAILSEHHPRPTHSDPAPKTDTQLIGSKDLGRDVGRESGWKVFDFAARYDFRDWLQNWQTASNQVIEKLEGIYDRVRETIVGRLGKIIDSIRNGTEAASIANRTIEQSSERLNNSVRQFEQQIGPAVGVLKMRADDELTKFKRDINLVEYAESLGYAADRRESSRSSVVMRNGSDKIIIATDDKDGHGVYFSVRDDHDNGSIIDFVQRRQGLNLGQVRQELRPWVGETKNKPPVKRKPEAERPKKPNPSNSDRRQVLATFMKMHPIQGQHPYLEAERGISTVILADPRFASMIRIDERKNAIFPHYDSNGISGYEIKNNDFTGFSKHGEKSLWYSSNLKNAEKIIITESAIDALSHAELKGTDKTVAYISIGGSMRPEQLELIKKVVGGKDVVIATDNDEAGNKYAEKIREFAPNALRDTPKLKDWNDDLRTENRMVATAGHDRGMTR
jgi:5S rRNA maturation endonuclease (ribonuclease M5)